VPAAQKPPQGSPGTKVTASTVPVAIGRVEGYNGQPDFYFKGLIDEVEVFGRALTQPEIQLIVNAGTVGKCKTLFPYTSSPSPLGAFSLPPGGQKVFDQVPAGSYTVTETPVPNGWEFKGLSCTDPETVISGAAATIHLDAGETVT